MGGLRQHHIGTGASGKILHPDTDKHKPASCSAGRLVFDTIIKANPVQAAMWHRKK
jgi:hypothetical protein